MTPTEDPEVRLEWVPRVEDVQEAMQARLAARATRTAVLLVAVGLAIVVLGVLAHSATLAVLGVLAPLLMLLFVVRSSKRRGASLWRSSPTFQLPTSAVVGSDGIVMSTGGVQRTYAWSAVGQVRETPGTFMLELTGEDGPTFLLLPKRACRDEAELSGLAGRLDQRSGTARSGNG
ncbi:MAG: YcxB-like protein [Actinomycetota bacterium]|jgi:hypothetical protein|nr:YcxB-like protein [Actinomycetota bacterium]